MLRIPLSCDNDNSVASENAIMANLSQIRNSIVSSDNALRSLTDVTRTRRSPNKHAMRSHWAQYCVSSQDCSLVLVKV